MVNIKLVEMVNAKFFRSVDGNALIAMTSAREGLSSFVFCGSRCWWTYYFVSIIFILELNKQKKNLVLNLIVLKNDNIVCILLVMVNQC